MYNLKLTCSNQVITSDVVSSSILVIITHHASLISVHFMTLQPLSVHMSSYRLMLVTNEHLTHQMGTPAPTDSCSYRSSCHLSVRPARSYGLGTTKAWRGTSTLSTGIDPAALSGQQDAALQAGSYARQQMQATPRLNARPF